MVARSPHPAALDLVEVLEEAAMDLLDYNLWGCCQLDVPSGWGCHLEVPSVGSMEVSPVGLAVELPVDL